jgi:hypothetical protein
MECKSRVGWDHVHVLRQASSSSSSSSSAFQEARRGILIVVDRRERIKLLVSSCFCCFYGNIIAAHCAPGSTRNLPPRYAAAATWRRTFCISLSCTGAFYTPRAYLYTGVKVENFDATFFLKIILLLFL